MMKKATILCLVAALLAVACAGKKNDAGELSAVQLPFENSGWKMSEVADSIQYIPLETTPACLVGQIDLLIPLDAALVVVDKEIARSVYLFGRDGHFLRQIGQRGEGPQEYASIEDVAIDRERGQVVLLDSGSERLLVYGLDGTFVQSVPLDCRAYDIECLGGGLLAGFLDYGANPDLEKEGRIPAAMLYDLNEGKPAGFYLYTDKNLRSGSILGNSANLVCDGERVQLIAPLNDTVYAVSGEGITADYSIDFGTDQKALQSQYLDYVMANRPDALSGPKKAVEMGVAQLIGVVPTEVNTVFSYRKGKDTFLAVRNRASGAIKTLQVSGLEALISDMDGATLFVPYGADQHHLYLMVHPYALETLPEEGMSEELRALKTSYREGDNPIVAMVRMKDF